MPNIKARLLLTTSAYIMSLVARPVCCCLNDRDFKALQHATLHTELCCPRYALPASRSYSTDSRSSADSLLHVRNHRAAAIVPG
eukprot:5637-Eustigmatos_ZCMA.PRE.1